MLGRLVCCAKLEFLCEARLAIGIALVGYANSCKELRRMASTKKDGTYRLLVRGALLSVYCSGMKHSKPSEYISLPSGYRDNYSEVFPKRY